MCSAVDLFIVFSHLAWVFYDAPEIRYKNQPRQKEEFHMERKTGEKIERQRETISNKNAFGVCNDDADAFHKVHTLAGSGISSSFFSLFFVNLIYIAI